MYPLVYSVIDKDGNKKSIVRQITVRSNDGPIITGVDDTIIKIGDSFNFLDNISATDKEDGNITSDIKVVGIVQNENIGEYDLTYSVEDSDGNKVIEKRTVIVRSNEKPQLTGNENTTIKVGDSFEPMIGIVAMDNEDGILTSAVKVKGDVDTSKEGVYDLLYSIIDKDRNETVVTRRINVRSNTIPELTGVDNIEIDYKKEFNALEGVIARDNEDGDLTNLIVMEGKIDSNMPGTYQLSYKVQDNDGNEKRVIREVKVKEDTRPNFNEVHNLVIKQGDHLDLMEGIVATDVKGNDIRKNITIKGIVDTEVSGTYNIIYSVFDNEGNKRSITREITVEKDNSPTIVGIENLSLKLGEKFNPMSGIIGKDKDCNDLTSLIRVIGNVDNNTKGEYKLVYIVTDKDGNEQIKSRTINIEEEVYKGKEFFKDIVIKKHEEFDPLLGIEEFYDKNSIEVIGEINKGEEGTYNLIYAITDKKGKKNSITRKIT
ncbi:MAG: immunoglobulin-like domain-containing protein, partial [Sarcina sp.]